MAIRQNRYNDPALGAAFENIASLFAPMDPQDTVNYTAARAKKEEADRLSALWANPTDPLAAARSSLLGVQQYGQTPEGFKYKVNADNTVTLQTNAADNTRAVQTNLVDNQFGLAKQYMSPLNQGQVTPGLPGSIASQFGVPELPRAEGLPKPLSETEEKAAERANLIGGGAVPEDMLVQNLFGAGVGDEYGLAPVYGRDKDGNIVVMQLSKGGTAKMTAMPEGVSPDLSTKAFESAKGTELGKRSGAAIAGEDSAIQKASNAMTLIDSITGGDTGAPDPALEGITGMIQGRLPPLTQAGTDLAARIDQVKGKAFLEAFESLKGGGAITELEGKVATDAIARLSRNQSGPAFVAALQDLRSVLATGLDRAQRNADRAAPAAGAPQTPNPAQTSPVPVQSVEEAMKLPSGTLVVSPDGRTFEVP